jgi:hypothetical protein
MKNNIAKLKLIFVSVSTFSFTVFHAQSANKIQEQTQNMILNLCGPVVITECCGYEFMEPQHDMTLREQDSPTHLLELQEWFLDSDGDGLGNPFAVVLAAKKPQGYSENYDDTNDTCFDCGEYTQCYNKQMP